VSDTGTVSDTVDVTEADFQNAVVEASNEAPVVVDFWAEWCGPCKMLGPVLEEATAARGVTLAKVDVDANQSLASEYGIRGIPAVKAFRNGHVVAEFVGAQSRTAVDAFLDELTRPPVAESVEDPELRDALAANDYARAFELLLGRLDDGNRDEIRELMVALFGELGHEHPLTVQYRRRLATALY
jgi:putative thioredoxin